MDFFYDSFCHTHLSKYFKPPVTEEQISKEQIEQMEQGTKFTQSYFVCGRSRPDKVTHDGVDESSRNWDRRGKNWLGLGCS